MIMTTTMMTKTKMTKHQHNENAVVHQGHDANAVALRMIPSLEKLYEVFGISINTKKTFCYGQRHNIYASERGATIPKASTIFGFH